MDIYDINLKDNSVKNDENGDFVTVVSIGSEKTYVNNVVNQQNDCTGYVTVLKIGDETNDVTEEVLVYRLPGERLGFGLKFEGGTKAAEFVTRLFIQSCAPDSPASRVCCSWGSLKIGDEVLEIDSVPVKTMTRIDCVRCLKDSNVVIKLLVKHRAKEINKNEAVPLVISAEKKRTPPPPPPVPPRKIPRKVLKDANNILIPPKGFDENANAVENPPIPPTRVTNGEMNGVKNHKHSPRSTRLTKHSPETSKKDRRPSHGSNLGPPDAEVYVDLFSQESVCSLSESDDTGSSISTVVDRLSSYPATTNSSFSGSLPSTPTAVQRHLDLSNTNFFDKDDVDDLITNENNFRNTQNDSHMDEDMLINGESCRSLKVGEENGTLRPPVSFQDAPLSYGNEDLRTIETCIREVERNALKNEQITNIDTEPKRPPPRAKYSSEKNVKITINNSQNEQLTKTKDYDLPRLVDFVPKSCKNSSPKDQTENEIKKREETKENCEMPAAVPEIWTENDDFYTLNWNPSTHLATIGEDEEEGTQEW